METAALKYCNSLQQSATCVAEIEKVLSLQHSATLYDPGTIELIACCCYCTNITGNKMAAFNEESLAFLKEVRKYDCLYNKFNKDFKNKFKKYNCWVEISEKCGTSADFRFLSNFRTQDFGFFLPFLSKTLRTIDRAIKLPANSRNSPSRISAIMLLLAPRSYAAKIATNGNILSQCVPVSRHLLQNYNSVTGCITLQHPATLCDSMETKL